MRTLGYIPDIIDNRDFILGNYLEKKRLPKIIDYTSQMTGVRDQGKEGTCVGYATVCGVKEYQDRKEYGDYVTLSPEWVYKECKKIDGIPDVNGTYIRTAMKILATKGVPREWCCKQKIPCAGLDKSGERFKIAGYARISNSIESLKDALYQTGPLAVGIYIYSNMYEVKLGILPDPEGSPVGGHAICLVGYNDNKEQFRFKNSWGISWGINGYGFLPYSYAEKALIDAWTCTDLIVEK